MKKKLFNLMKYFTLLLIAFILNSCGVITLHISEEYQTKLHPPAESEQVIGRVTLEGRVWESPIGEVYTPRNPPPSKPMGKPMSTSIDIHGRPEFKRHLDEDILDELLDEAQNRFPNEIIDIRNATKGYRYIGMGKILRRKVESNGNGTSRTVRASEINRKDEMVEVPVYQFRIIFYADIGESFTFCVIFQSWIIFNNYHKEDLDAALQVECGGACRRGAQEGVVA